MSVREIEKDIKAKGSYKFWHWVFIMGLVLVLTLGLFLAMGYNMDEVFFWDFKKVLVMADLYLNAFFHRLFDSITAVFGAIEASEGVKDYFDLLSGTLSYIWSKKDYYYIPKEYLTNIDTYQKLKDESYKYFWLLVFSILLWIYLINYFFSYIKIPKKISKYLYYPIKAYMFTRVSEEYLEELGADGGNFFENVENKLIKQEIEVVDGYQRVEHLKYLRKIPLVISSGKKYKKELLHIRESFKSDQEFLDLFRIIEGYLAPKGKPFLFDEFVNHLKRDDYEKWTAFNKRDKVYFSLDAMLYFLNDESEDYVKFINKKLLRGRGYIVRFLNKYKKNLIYDRVRVTKMLFAVNNKETPELRIKDPEIVNAYENMMRLAKGNDTEAWWKAFKERLPVVLNAYFRFILLRKILRQYTNIPAGTIVVKLQDYTLRNIVDNYDLEALVAINENKNDGLSQSFENDIITNIFFLTYYVYNKYYKRTTIDERMAYKWNIDVSEIVEEEEAESILNEALKEIEKYKNEVNQKKLDKGE